MVKRILDELERDNIVRDMCVNMRVAQNDIDDLIQEIYVILLEYDRDRLIEIYNRKQLRYFLVGIVKRQYRSCNSPYYKKYKKYYNIIDGNYVNKEVLNEDDIDDFE
jgi:hypothetical protein